MSKIACPKCAGTGDERVGKHLYKCFWCLGEGIVDAGADDARNYVVDHLHWEGGSMRILDTEESTRARLLADGFGDLSCMAQNVHRDQLAWQWSHVDDSSAGAFIRMADYIAGQRYHEWRRSTDHRDTGVAS